MDICALQALFEDKMAVSAEKEYGSLLLYKQLIVSK